MEARNELHVRRIEFVGHHGVGEQERAEGRRFQVDAVVTIDAVRGFSSDRLGDTVDYRKIAAIIVDEGRGSCHLVEHLAERIATRCLAITHVLAVDLTIYKHAPDVVGGPEWVGVRVVRTAS